jgi:hypothetical protein
VQKFKGTTRDSQEGAIQTGTTRATARLPGLDIEIMYRGAADGDAEQIFINLRAVPSFEAFGRALELANPFAFWAQAAQLAWLPWLETARTLALPWPLVPWLPQPPGDATSRSALERSNRKEGRPNAI